MTTLAGPHLARHPDWPKDTCSYVASAETWPWTHCIRKAVSEFVVVHLYADDGTGEGAQLYETAYPACDEHATWAREEKADYWVAEVEVGGGPHRAAP